MPQQEPDWLRQARKEGLIIAESGMSPGTFVTHRFKQPIDMEISEDTFQQHVLNVAEDNGWLRAHFRTVRIARADGSFYYATPVQADGEGFPDLVLVRERIIYAELKSEIGILRPEQEVWKKAIEAAGGEYYLWRPSDWAEINKILRRG
jgi:hypothetical protein